MGWWFSLGKGGGLVARKNKGHACILFRSENIRESGLVQLGGNIEFGRVKAGHFMTYRFEHQSKLTVWKLRIPKLVHIIKTCMPKI